MGKTRTLLVFIIVAALFSSCRLQENMLFYPDKLPNDYAFAFPEKFEECYFKVDKHNSIHGVLFKAAASKGLVFYLHGNGGAIDSWGSIADTYLKNNYDFFILDYRGYGKSGGKIKREKQMHRDIQTAYNSLKTNYNENNIVIIGYSIGTGFATKLASTNNPKLLILKAPYYSMVDLAHQYMKFVPAFLIKYKIKTNEFIPNVKCPIVIFHGDKDEVVYYGSSEKLVKLLKPGDRLITLKGQHHNGINDNAVYKEELGRVLKQP